MCYLYCVFFSYSYGGYATSESAQVGAQPVYSVNVQQVNILEIYDYQYLHFVYIWLGGRVVRVLDLGSTGRRFKSRPPHSRLQPWAIENCAQ